MDADQQPGPGAGKTSGCRWKATPSAMTPVRLPRHKILLIGTPKLRRTPSPEKLTASGCHGSPGVAAERAEVDLPVSGLKPDWPRRAATAGIAAVRWVVPLEQVGTADDRPGASPESVRPDADAQADCARQKACKRRPFGKRLMGFEPTTFCMASRARGDAIALISPQIGYFDADRARGRPRLSPRDHGGLLRGRSLSRDAGPSRLSACPVAVVWVTAGVRPGPAVRDRRPRPGRRGVSALGSAYSECTTSARRPASSTPCCSASRRTASRTADRYRWSREVLAAREPVDPDRRRQWCLPRRERLRGRRKAG
jgi:hypothetical protein